MPSLSSSSSSSPTPSPSIDGTSWNLLSRVRHGDASALSQLIGRYAPRLKRWASGQLPLWTRTFTDTPDIVQDVLLHSLGRLPRLDRRGRYALRAYFRKAIVNRIRDEQRRVARQGPPQPLPDSVRDPRPSILDDMVSAE